MPVWTLSAVPWGSGSVDHGSRRRTQDRQDILTHKSARMNHSLQCCGARQLGGGSEPDRNSYRIHTGRYCGWLPDA
jgi:hypothetical protein